MTAIELSWIGCEITLLECSRGSLEDKGAGIILRLPLIETLKERHLVGENMAHIPTLPRSFLVKDGGGPARGRTIWDQPIDISTTNWDVLFRELRE